MVGLLIQLSGASAQTGNEPKDALGCWRKDLPLREHSRPRGYAEFCYHAGGWIYGGTVDDNDGWDWSRQWSHAEPGVLIIDGARCSWLIDEGRKILKLSNGCALAGDWLRKE